VTKQKSIKKTLTQFRFKNNIKPPYTILADGPFFAEAARIKCNLKEEFPKLLLGNKASYVTTRCIIEEISKLGKEYEQARLLARKTKKVKCRHTGGDLDGRTCVVRNVHGTNPLHYLVATQDPDLIRELRKRHVPILHISHGGLHLEKPSTSKKIVEKDEDEDEVNKAEAPKKIAKRGGGSGDKTIGQKSEVEREEEPPLELEGQITTTPISADDEEEESQNESMEEKKSAEDSLVGITKPSKVAEAKQKKKTRRAGKKKGKTSVSEDSK